MPAFAKTLAPCDCGWLSGPINDPSTNLSYDALNNKIVLGDQTQYVIYHCPFCGGKFPDSSRPIWVPIVPQAEFERVRALVAGLATVDGIFERLGKPDYDSWSYPGAEYRCIEYYGLSEFLSLEFLVTRTGLATHTIQIKSMSPRHQGESDREA